MKILKKKDNEIGFIESLNIPSTFRVLWSLNGALHTGTKTDLWSRSMCLIRLLVPSLQLKRGGLSPKNNI